MIDEKQLKEKYQQAVKIAMALIVGCVSFGAVVLLLGNSGAAAPTSGFAVYRAVAWSFGIVTLGMSFYLKQVFLQKNKSTHPPVKTETAVVGTKLTTLTILMMAMVEGAVFFGMIIAFVTRNPQDLLAPAAIGIIGFSAHFPKYHDWVNWAREQ